MTNEKGEEGGWEKEIHQRVYIISVIICEICGTKPSHEEKSDEEYHEETKKRM